MDKKTITGFVLVKIEPVSRLVPVQRSLNKIDGIIEMHEITGEYDLLIKIMVDDMDELRAFVDSLRNRKGVYGLETIISVHRTR